MSVGWLAAWLRLTRGCWRQRTAVRAWRPSLLVTPLLLLTAAPRPPSHCPNTA